MRDPERNSPFVSRRSGGTEIWSDQKSLWKFIFAETERQRLVLKARPPWPRFALTSLIIFSRVFSCASFGVFISGPTVLWKNSDLPHNDSN